MHLTSDNDDNIGLNEALMIIYKLFPNFTGVISLRETVLDNQPYYSNPNNGFWIYCLTSRKNKEILTKSKQSQCTLIKEKQEGIHDKSKDGINTVSPIDALYSSRDGICMDTEVIFIEIVHF